MKIEVSLHVTPCSLIIKYQNVGMKAQRPSSVYYSTINKETIHFSEILHTKLHDVTSKKAVYLISLTFYTSSLSYCDHLNFINPSLGLI